MSRKTICFITALPESIYAQRYLSGIITQCQKYAYDIAVFAPLTNLSLQHQNYLDGELNIYNLINFDKFDGVLVDASSLLNTDSDKYLNRITDMLKEKCKKPVIIIGNQCEDFPSFVTSDRPLFREITRHVMEVHHCRDIYFLTGHKGHPTSLDRLGGFLDVLSENAHKPEGEYIFYGDFWYSGGAALADRIISGEIHKPDAIICASDHMAIGLANRLANNGFRIPEDIVITGFDATQEAAINDISITSFVSESAKTAADAVDELRHMIEPGSSIERYQSDTADLIRTGMSCGCKHNFQHTIKLFRDAMYQMHRDYTNESFTVDIGRLIESNMVEYLSDTTSLEECIQLIYNFTYLLFPYDEFFLCLEDHWMEHNANIGSGYSMQIREVIHCTPTPNSGHYLNGPVFDTSEMLPEMFSNNHEPSIYYFFPVHFLEKTLGYAVIRNNLTTEHKISCVTRNWIRNVNNALEIIRTENRLTSLSIQDSMTGAYNRMGMELLLDKMTRNAPENANVLAFVIDIDRLKYVNDTFGHEEGDFTICTIGNVAKKITFGNELCVRAGGDEFYIIGIGDYTSEDASERIVMFNAELSALKESHIKPYPIMASIGGACIPLNSGLNITGIIRIADAKMYENKVQRKIQRKD